MNTQSLKDLRLKRKDKFQRTLLRLGTRHDPRAAVAEALQAAYPEWERQVQQAKRHSPTPEVARYIIVRFQPLFWRARAVRDGLIGSDGRAVV